ncbi:MAG: hypothetical protein LBI19_01005, partial [Oscillospiraceae bacterium]|nr:hypothetical protein [Oscillospiraceae bacterium]
NGEHIKYTPITNERYRTGDPSVEGMWGVGTSNPSYTFAWARFKLVTGLFTIISDGNNWGLPDITNVVESNAKDSNGDPTGRPTVNSSGLGEGRAVIQRPYEFDRRGDNVIAWDTYILSAADTAAMEIGLHDIGRQMQITFEHPERERLSHWVPGSEAVLDADVYRPGQYHRLDVETVFGYDWIGEKTLYHGLSSITATAIDGALPQNAQVFVDYSNAGTLNSKIRVTDDGSAALKNYMNADVIVITGVDPRNPGRGEVVRWVYIENYVIGQVSNVPGDGTGWNWTFSGGGSGAQASNIGSWIRTEGKGPEGTYTPARWDLVAIGKKTIPAQWIADGDYINQPSNLTRYWFKPVEDQEEGLVTSVQGSADVNPGSGFMTMGGVTYNMLQYNNWIRAFQTADVTNKRTITMWHGLVVHIDTTPIKRNYAVVTAAGVDGRTSYNANTWKNMVDLFLEDGTHMIGLELEKIVMGNSAGDATARPIGQSVGAGQYGTDSGNTNNGDPLWFQTSSGWNVFGSKKQLKDNVFEYRISGNRVTLYEIRSEQVGGDRNFTPSNRRVDATQGGRFNSTWGTTLGNTLGMNNTRGLMLLSNDDLKSAVFVKTKNTLGEDVYNVYNQSVPGFNNVTALTTQTYRMNIDGDVEASSAGVWNTGAFVRVAFADVGGAISSTVRTRWAVALDWWVQNDSNSLYAGTVKAMLSDGTEATLTCRDERTTDGTAFKADPIRRGDVFLYESDDGTPNTISRVTILDSDALAGSYVFSGSLSQFGILGFNGVTGHTLMTGNAAMYYGTQGNNHYYVNARGSEQAARASAAAVADWGISDNGQWNLYIFEAGVRGNYTSVDQVLVVRRNDGTWDSARPMDNRNIPGKATAIRNALLDVELENRIYDDQAEFDAEALSAIQSIFDAYGPSVYLTANPTIGTLPAKYDDSDDPGSYDGAYAEINITDLAYRIAGVPIATMAATLTAAPFSIAGVLPNPGKVILPALEAAEVEIIVGKMAVNTYIATNDFVNENGFTNIIKIVTGFTPGTDNSNGAVAAFVKTFADSNNAGFSGTTSASVLSGSLATKSPSTAASLNVPGEITVRYTMTKDGYSDTLDIKVIVPAEVGRIQVPTAPLTSTTAAATLAFNVSIFDDWGKPVSGQTVKAAVAGCVVGSDDSGSSTSGGVAAFTGVTVNAAVFRVIDEITFAGNGGIAAYIPTGSVVLNRFVADITAGASKSAANQWQWDLRADGLALATLMKATNTYFVIDLKDIDKALFDDLEVYINAAEANWQAAESNNLASISADGLYYFRIDNFDFGTGKTVQAIITGGSYAQMGFQVVGGAPVENLGLQKAYLTSVIPTGATEITFP